MAIDSITQGNLDVAEWMEKPFDGKDSVRSIKPCVLQLASKKKGAKSDGPMPLEQVTHHRCPTRDAMSWIGLYSKVFEFRHPFHARRNSRPVCRGISCGWAIVRVKESKIIGVMCGVIQVEENSEYWVRCDDLRRKIQPLLTPAPSRVFSEGFISRGNATDALSFQLRAAIAMEVTASHGIPFCEVLPQVWKAELGVKGGEVDKDVIKRHIEALVGCRFPEKLPNTNGGRDLKFRTDTSDAVGIGIYGARQHDDVSFAQPFTISSPALALPKRGEKRKLDADSTQKKRSS